MPVLIDDTDDQTEVRLGNHLEIVPPVGLPIGSTFKVGAREFIKGDSSPSPAVVRCVQLDRLAPGHYEELSGDLQVIAITRHYTE